MSPEPAPGVRTPDWPRSGAFAWRDAAATYAVFAAGVVAATWPLVLNPARLWPPHHDPRVFTWVMASVARRLFTEPLAFAHANAFYPFGESLAFSELLLLPSLLGAPGFLWGNPILTYNLLLLGLWPLNGTAMAWVAHRLTGSRSAAWLAGAAFCLSPYFTEYYLEFQMLLAAFLPVALLAWVRWLETLEARWLLVAVGALAAQALTSWYYGIILALGLVTLGLAFLCLRWHGWRWRRALAQSAAGALALGVLLLPFALPYFTAHAELGFERSARETAAHYADLFTFIEPGRRSLLYGALSFAPTGHIAETSAFPGVTVLVLAALSLGLLKAEAPMPTRQTRLSRVALVVLLVALGLLAWSLAVPRGRYHLGPLIVRPRARELLYVTSVLGLLLLALRGWAARGAHRPRSLSPGDWVRLLLLLAGVFGALALGPVIHLGRRQIGPGLYMDLYPIVLPLHAVRVTVRFAVLTLAGLALLAALGVRALEARLQARPVARRLALGAIFLTVGLEYAVVPARYERVRWAPRPVDDVLRREPRDLAVLEWPTNVPAIDADAMVQSLWHGKRLVNGLSGFVPALLPQLSALLSTPGEPFPGADAEAALRRIYPLGYLVVRLGDTRRPWRPAWQAVRRAPPSVLRFQGTFGREDLYTIVPLPERGLRVERWIAFDVLRRHPVLHVGIRPMLRGATLDQWVEVRLNERRVARVSLDREETATLLMPPPWRRAMPNVVALEYRYSRPVRDARYRIGTTGTLSPGDLRVRSAGQPYGDASSILLNGVELSPNQRGYNLVAVDSAGVLIGVAAFDTFADAAAAARLAAWVHALSPGTIVAGAVRDEASDRLSAEAVRALSALGVAADLRDRFRQSHAFVGVKGAPSDSALEAVGPRALEVVVGAPAEGLGFELARFDLEAPTDHLVHPADDRHRGGPRGG
jgi:Interleukin-like EMT inducer